MLPDTHEEEYNGYDSEEDEQKYDDGDSEDQVEDFVGEDHDSSSSHKSESDDDSDFAGTQDSNLLHLMPTASTYLICYFLIIQILQPQVVLRGWRRCNKL